MRCRKLQRETIHEPITNCDPRLLSPLGQWRATIPRSKGKRHKRNEHKRKREAEQSHVDQQEASAIQTPAPTIGNHVTIGYNTTMRAISNEALQADGDSRIAVVFLTQPTNSVQYAHLPILAAQATPPVVLVPLLNSESRLCIALGLARVGIIGLRKDAPGSSAILAMTQEIEPVQVPFLDEVRRGQWLETNIECATSIAQDTRET